MKEISLRGCNHYYHVSGKYSRGKPYKVNDTLAKELMALRTEQGQPYFILQSVASEEDAKTPVQHHEDRINAGEKVLKLEDVVPDATDKKSAVAAAEAEDVEVEEEETPEAGIEV
jgi:hypothetical protein